ncbi:MAG: hypothetical protein M1821_000496 [Bathelium mastoideum]|nr:MAG: hypothetical protein M1821_000496 [Bathelium mastoideum]
MGSASPFPLLLLSFLSLASASPIYQQPFPHNEYMEPRETSYMNFWVSTKDFSTPFYTGYDVCDTSLHSSALPWDAQLSSYIQRSNGSCVSQGSYDINMDGLSAAYFAVMPQEEDLDVCMGETSQYHVVIQVIDNLRNADPWAPTDGARDNQRLDKLHANSKTDLEASLKLNSTCEFLIVTALEGWRIWAIH